MEKIIEVINLNFSNLFKGLYLDVYKNEFLMIIGKSSCGKTILANILSGIIPTYDNILIESELISYYDKKNILLVPFIDNSQHTKVLEILKEYDKEEVNKLLKQIKKIDLLDKNIDMLSSGEIQILNIILALLKKDKIIIIDDALNMVDIVIKEKLLKNLKKLSDEKISTIIYFTTDIEDLIYSSNIALINEQKIEVIGSKNELLDKEQKFTKINRDLPFLANLCLKLKYYGLVDKLILNEVKLVNKLWK